MHNGCDLDWCALVSVERVTSYSAEDGRSVGRFLGLSMREVTQPNGPVKLEAQSRVQSAVLDQHGFVHAGALFTMCDCVGGFCGGLGALPDGWVVTTNLMIRTAPTVVASPLVLNSAVLRRGKTSVVTSINVVDAVGAFVAAGTLTSAILVPSDGIAQWDRPARLDMPSEVGGIHFDDWLGISIRDGAVSIELTDELRNPWGIMHGGATSALVDRGAVEAVTHTTGVRERLRTNHVVLHFLAPAKIGPVRASGRVLGTRPDGYLVEVEVFDEGSDNRLVALAVATVAVV